VGCCGSAWIGIWSSISWRWVIVNIKSPGSPLLLHSLPLLPWRTITTSALSPLLLLLGLSLLLSLLLPWLLLPPLWRRGSCWHLAARELPDLCC
jgi:hypothetical protein